MWFYTIIDYYIVNIMKIFIHPVYLLFQQIQILHLNNHYDKYKITLLVKPFAIDKLYLSNFFFRFIFKKSNLNYLFGF